MNDAMIWHNVNNKSELSTLIEKLLTKFNGGILAFDVISPIEYYCTDATDRSTEYLLNRKNNSLYFLPAEPPKANWIKIESANSIEPSIFAYNVNKSAIDILVCYNTGSSVLLAVFGGTVTDDYPNKFKYLIELINSIGYLQTIYQEQRLIKDIFSFSLWGHAPDTDNDVEYLFISSAEEIRNNFIRLATNYGKINEINLSNLPELTPWEDYASTPFE